MDKLVNIVSKVAIRTVTPKICGVHKNILMSTGDILRCICMRAHVEEILPDGSTVVLNSTNYNKDNTKKIHYVIADEMGIETTSNEIFNNVDGSADTGEENVESVDGITDIIPVETENDEEAVEASNVAPNNNHTNHNNHNGGKKHKKKK